MRIVYPYPRYRQQKAIPGKMDGLMTHRLNLRGMLPHHFDIRLGSYLITYLGNGTVVQKSFPMSAVVGVFPYLHLIAIFS